MLKLEDTGAAALRSASQSILGTSSLSEFTAALDRVAARERLFYPVSCEVSAFETRLLLQAYLYKFMQVGALRWEQEDMRRRERLGRDSLKDTREVSII